MFLFFWKSFTPALCVSNNTTQWSSLLSPSLEKPFKWEAPGQFPLPSFAACHVVYSAQLFKKCWISTMAFTAALSTFVWSNLGWMRWVPEQGELSCSVHYNTTPHQSLPLVSHALYVCAAAALEELLLQCFPGVWSEALGFFGCHCYLPLHGPLLGPRWQPAVQGVSNREALGSSSSRSTGTSQSLVSLLNIVDRVGGEERSG